MRPVLLRELIEESIAPTRLALLRELIEESIVPGILFGEEERRQD
jgi:hypothetical protein